MASVTRRAGVQRVVHVLTAVVFTTAATVTASAAAPLPQATPTAPLTLAEAETRALTSNPTIVAARLQRPVDEAGVAVARERPNPDLSFTNTRQTPRDEVAFSVPVELGGKRSRRIDLAKATVASGEATLAETIAGVQNDVRRAFYQVLAADASVRLAQEAQALAQRARDAAQARFTAGEVPQSDVTQADLDLASAEDDTADAGGEALAARADLNTLLGQPASSPLTLDDNLTTPGPIPTLAQALAEAGQINAGLAVLDKQIAQQAAQMNLAKSQRVPDFNAGGGVSWGAQPDFSVGWSVTFDMNVPVFTSHQAGVQVETAELARLHAGRNARALAIAGAVEAAYARLSSARARMDQFQTRSLPLSNQVEQMAQRAYASGEKGLTDLLQALQQVRDIRQKALQSSLDFQLALADLEQAIGAPIR
jgi:cobalt-zinc-cadmium efflux system outer membrane protein